MGIGKAFGLEYKPKNWIKNYVTIILSIRNNTHTIHQNLNLILIMVVSKPRPRRKQRTKMEEPAAKRFAARDRRASTRDR